MALKRGHKLHDTTDDPLHTMQLREGMILPSSTVIANTVMFVQFRPDKEFRVVGKKTTKECLQTQGERDTMGR